MSSKEANIIYGGTFENLPCQEKHNIVVFLSSTFTDMTVERNYIMKHSIPKIRNHCMRNRLTFQLIDMRWGVRDEASNDHSTTDIVLEELRKAKKLSKGPYFVGFLGDRYGNRFLPNRIEGKEFKLLRRISMKLGYDVTNLDIWYQRDENAEPAEYYLVPISTILPYYNDDRDESADKKKKDEAQWKKIEAELSQLLRAAADQAHLENLISKETKFKYNISVTESEFQEGILKPSNEEIREKVICFFRSFVDIKIEDELAWRYIDLINGKYDNEAAELRERLKWTKVQPRLTANEQKKFSVLWTPSGILETNPDHQEYLANLAEVFETRQMTMIDLCLSSNKEDPLMSNPLYKEVLHHLHFAKRRLDNFQGREELLTQIKNRLMTYQAVQGEVTKECHLYWDQPTQVDSPASKHMKGSSGVANADRKSQENEEKASFAEISKRLKDLNVVFTFARQNVNCDPNQDLREELIKLPENISSYSVPLVLFGDSGSGKTALMCKIAELSKEWFPNSYTIVRFFGTSSTSSSIRHALCGICVQIWSLYNMKLPIGLDLDADFQYLCSYFQALLWTINSMEKPLVLVLDSVDQLSSADHAAYMHWLPLKLPPFVKIILSVLPRVSECYFNMRKSALEKNQYIEIKSLSNEIETADAIITKMLKDNNRRITKKQRKFVLGKIEKAHNSLYVTLVAHESLKWKSSRKISSIDIGDNVTECIHKFFGGLEREHGETLVKKLFGYLGVSKEGLAPAEIEDILSIDDVVLQDTYLYHLPPDPTNIRCPTSVISKLLSDVNEYVVNRMSGFVPVTTWFHRQFKEVSKERYYAEKQESIHLHEVLVEYYTGKWHNVPKPLKLFKKKKGTYPDADRQVPAQHLQLCEGMYNIRKLVELPYHLVKAKKYKLFQKEILTFDWLYSKCVALSALNVLDDLSQLLTSMDEDGDLDADVFNDAKLLQRLMISGIDSIRKDASNLALQILAKLTNMEGKSETISKIVSDAHNWVTTTSLPLLYPKTNCMPTPGNYLISSVDIELFIIGDTDRNRMVGLNKMQLHPHTKCLYVIQPPSTRNNKTRISVLSLAENGSCITKEMTNINAYSLNFWADNKYMTIEDDKGYFSLYRGASISANLNKHFNHSVELVAISASGEYIIVSSLSMLFIYKDHGNSMNVVYSIDSSLETEQNPSDSFNYSQQVCQVNYIGTSPDEKFLVYSNTVEQYYKVHELVTGKYLFTVREEGSHRAFNFAYRFTSIKTNIITKDNILLYSGFDKKGSLYMFDLDKGKPCGIEINLWEFYSIDLTSLHPSEQYVAIACSGSTVVNGVTNKQWKVFDIQNRRIACQAEHKALFSPTGGVKSITMFGKDLLLVASSAEGSAICISYCGSVGKPEEEVIPYRYLTGHSQTILQVIVTAENDMMYSAGQDNTIKFWDIGTIVDELESSLQTISKKELVSVLTQNFEREETSLVSSESVVIHRKGQEVYAGLTSGELLIKHLKADQVKQKTKLFSDPIKKLILSSSGKYLICLSKQGFTIWDTEKGCEHKQLPNRLKDFQCAAEANDILVVGKAGMEAQGVIYNIVTGDLIKKVTLLYSFYAVAISPSGSKFVSTMFDYPILVSVHSEDEMAGIDMKTIDTMMSSGICVAISPDEKFAMSGSSDGSIRVIDMTSTYRFHFKQRSSVVAASFSPDSQYVVSGGYKTIFVWSLHDGSLKFSINKHENFIRNILFNEKGTHFITTALDKKVILWDFRRGISATTFSSHNDVNIVDFGPKGRVAFYAENCCPIAVLHPNPSLKRILKGKQTLNIGNALRNAQGVALSFSSQKIETEYSAACSIL